MNIIIIINAIALFFDGFLTNYLSFLPNDLTLFNPLLTITSIFIIYPLFQGDDKKYLIYSFILGFIYDLFYTNLLFFDGIVFIALAFTTIFIYKNLDVSYIKMIFYLAFMIVLYEVIFAGFILLFNLVPISFDKLLYLISHSLILNIIFGVICYTIIEHLPKKYHTRKINCFQKKI